MNKILSVWDKKMLTLAIRWRWAVTGLVALQISSLVQGYKAHDVHGWLLLPSAWVLPWLTFGCAGTCVFTAAIWTAYRHRLRLRV